MRVREVLSRLGLVIFGLVLSLVVLEVVLQVGSRFVPDTGVSTPPQAVGDSSRVLCLGDSNTYGLSVERAQAYPQALEGLWNAKKSTGALQVFNLGVPGMNSSLLRNRLPQILQAFEPDIVLMMVGANDAWTVPAPLTEDGNEDLGGRRLYFIWHHSRVFRFLYMIYRRATRPPLPPAHEGERAAIGADDLQVTVKRADPSSPGENTVRVGDRVIDLTWTGKATEFPDWQPDLLLNLTAMIEEVRQTGARVVLMTYPSSEPHVYGVADAMIRHTAELTESQLIDLAAAFGQVCPTGDCPDLLRPDQHPTAKGYAFVANTIMQQLSVATPSRHEQ